MSQILMLQIEPIAGLNSLQQKSVIAMGMSFQNS